MRVHSYYNSEIFLTGKVIAFLPEGLAVVQNESNGFLNLLGVQTLKVIEEVKPLDRIQQLESLLREVKNELSPFTHEDAILDVSVKIREVLED